MHSLLMSGEIDGVAIVVAMAEVPSPTHSLLTLYLSLSLLTALSPTHSHLTFTPPAHTYSPSLHLLTHTYSPSLHLLTHTYSPSHLTLTPIHSCVCCRGRCSVHEVDGVSSISRFLDEDNTFFYNLGYTPETRCVGDWLGLVCVCLSVCLSVCAFVSVRVVCLHARPVHSR